MPVNTDLANEQWTRFQYCRDRGFLEFLEKAYRCEQFFAGDQWRVEDLNTLALQKRPAITINKILSTMGTVFGEQIYNQSEIMYRPSTGAAPETADALTKLWMSTAHKNQWQWVRGELFCDGAIRSRGFIDMRLDFTDNMRGSLVIKNLNSKNVIPDPDAEEYDPDSWNDVFTSKWMTPQDISILYSEDDAEILKRKDGSSFPYGYDSIERVRDRFGGILPLSGYYGVTETYGVRRNIRVLDRQYHRLDKQLHFVDVETGDMRVVPRDWDRNKIASVIERAQGRLNTIKKFAKRVRWTVTADDVVLHDDWSPYKHFTVIPYFPYFRYGRTIGVVENLLGPQELLNKVSSQELHVVNTTANSGWKVKTGSLQNMSIEELEQKGATTGLVLELDDIDAAEKIQPNQTPQGLDRISYKAEEHIKTISNVSDSMQGFDREDVAAKAIDYKTKRGAVNMVKMMDNLKRSDFIVARNALDIFQEFYTEERIVHITHDDVSKQVETITVNQYDPVTDSIKNDLTLGEYSIIISSMPARETLEDSQFAQIMEMKEAGIQIPDEVVIDNSRLIGKADILKKIEAKSQSPEAQQQAQLQLRLQQADVTEREAKATNLQADARLKQAKTEAELANMQMDATRLQHEISGGPEAQDENLTQREDVKAAHDMHLKAQDQAHKHGLEEARFGLEADGHQHEKAMREQEVEAQNQAALEAAKQPDPIPAQQQPE